MRRRRFVETISARGLAVPTGKRQANPRPAAVPPPIPAPAPAPAPARATTDEEVVAAVESHVAEFIKPEVSEQMKLPEVPPAPEPKPTKKTRRRKKVKPDA